MLAALSCATGGVGIGASGTVGVDPPINYVLLVKRLKVDMA